MKGHAGVGYVYIYKWTIYWLAWLAIPYSIAYFKINLAYNQMAHVIVDW